MVSNSNEIGLNFNFDIVSIKNNKITQNLEEKNQNNIIYSGLRNKAVMD